MYDYSMINVIIIVIKGVGLPQAEVLFDIVSLILTPSHI